MAGDKKASSKKKQAPTATKLKGTTSSTNNQPPPSSVGGLSSPSKTIQLRQAVSNTQVATPPTSAKKFKKQDYYAALEEQSSSEFVGIVSEPREKRLQKLPDAKLRKQHHKSSSKKDGSRGGVVDENEDLLAYQAGVVDRSRAYPRDANALGGVSADATHPYIVGDFSPALIQHSKVDREKIKPGVRAVPTDLDNPNAVFADYHRHQLLQQPSEKKRFSKLRRNKKQKQAEKDEAAIMAERRFPQPPRVGSETFKFFRRVYANIWRLQISDEEIRTPRRAVTKQSSLYAPQSDIDLDDNYDDYIDDDENSQAIAPGNATYWSHSSADDLLSQNTPATPTVPMSRKASRQQRRKEAADRRRASSSRQREKEQLKQQKQFHKKQYQQTRLSADGRESGAATTTTDDDDDDDDDEPHEKKETARDSSSHDPDRLSTEQKQWRTSGGDQIAERPSAAARRSIPSKQTKKPAAAAPLNRLTAEGDEKGDATRRSSRLSVRESLSDIKQKRSQSKDLRRQRKLEKHKQKLEDDRNSMRLSASQQQFADALAADDDDDDDDRPAPAAEVETLTTTADDDAESAAAADVGRKSDKAKKKIEESKKPAKEEQGNSSKQRAKSKQQRPPVSSTFTVQLAGVPDTAVMQSRLSSVRPSSQPEEQNLIDFDEQAVERKSPQQQQQQQRKSQQPRSSAPWQQPLSHQQQRDTPQPPPVRRSQQPPPSYLSTTDPPRQSVSDQFYSAIETTEQLPTNLVTNARLSLSQPKMSVGKYAADQKQPATLFRKVAAAPPPYQTRRSVPDASVGGRGSSIREASYGGEDDELLLLPVEDDDDGEPLELDENVDDEDDENFEMLVPARKKASSTSRGTSPVPKKELKHRRKEQSRDAKRAAAEQKQTEKDRQRAKTKKTAAEQPVEDDITSPSSEAEQKFGGKLTAENADENADLDADEVEKRRFSRLSVRGPVSNGKEKRSRSKDLRLQQKQQKKSEKVDKPKVDKKSKKATEESADDAEAVVETVVVETEEGIYRDPDEDNDDDGDQKKRRSSRLSVRERVSGIKQKRSESKAAAKEDRKKQKKSDDKTAAPMKSADINQSKKQPVQPAIRLTVEDESESSTPVDLLRPSDDAADNRLTTDEDEESGKRRSSRLSMRALKEQRSRSRQRKKEKQEQKQLSKSATSQSSSVTPSSSKRSVKKKKKFTIEDDNGSPLIGMAASDADEAYNGDHPPAEAEIDDDGKRRSSRLSARSLREHRSQSKQRKEEKQLEKAAAAKQQLSTKPGTGKKTAKQRKPAENDDELVSSGELETSERGNSVADDRLAAKNDDEDGQRRSSRLSMRNSREQRSRSKQRSKADKQQKKQQQETLDSGAKPAKRTDSKGRLQRKAAESREPLPSGEEEDDTREQDDDDEIPDKSKRKNSRKRDAKQQKLTQADEADNAAQPLDAAAAERKRRKAEKDDVFIVDVQPNSHKQRLLAAQQQQQLMNSGSYDDEQQLVAEKPAKKKPLGRLASTLLGRKGSKQPAVGEHAASGDSPSSEAELAKPTGQPTAKDKKAAKQQQKKKHGKNHDQKTQASLVSITPNSNNDIDNTPIDATDDQFMISEEQHPYYDARGSSVAVDPLHPHQQHPSHGKHKVISRILHPKSHHKLASAEPSGALPPKQIVRTKQQQQQQQRTKPPSIVLRGQNGELVAPAYHTIGGDTLTAENEDEDGQQQRRSSRFSLRGRFSSKDKVAKTSKQKFARDKKKPSSESRTKSSNDVARTSTDNDTSESPLANMTSGLDSTTETGESRLTAEQNADGQPHRRSSRFSVRGLKDQRSRSKQRKQDKRRQKDADKKGAIIVTDSKKGPLSMEESETALARTAAGSDGRDDSTVQDNDSPGNRLTTTDDEGARRSSRFSIRDRISARKDKRSRSKQARKSKQQLEQDDREDRAAKKGKVKPSADNEKALIQLTDAEIDEHEADARLTATEDEDSPRRSSRFSIRGMKDRRSQSKQRQQQKKIEKDAAMKPGGSKSKEKLSKSEAPTHLSVEEDGNALLGMTASDAEDAQAGNQRLTAEDDDDGKRRSSRFSVRGIKENRSRSKQRKNLKKLDKQAGKLPSKSNQTKGTETTSDNENAFRNMMAHEDDATPAAGTRLTADDDDDDGKRRSSRFSVRGRHAKSEKDRSRSRQKRRPPDEEGITADEQEALPPRNSEKLERGRFSIQQRFSRQSSRNNNRASAEEQDEDEKPKKHHHILCHVSGSRQRRHHPPQNNTEDEDEAVSAPSDGSPPDDQTDLPRSESKRKLSKQQRKASRERSKSAQRSKKKKSSSAVDTHIALTSGEGAYDDDRLDEAASYAPTKRQAPVKPSNKDISARTMTGQPSTVTEETELVSTRPDEISQKSKKSASKRRRELSVQQREREEPRKRSWSKRRQKDTSAGDVDESEFGGPKKSRHASRKAERKQKKGSRDDGYVSTTTAATGDDDVNLVEEDVPDETLDERRARMHKIAEKSRKQRVPSKDASRRRRSREPIEDDVADSAAQVERKKSKKEKRSRSKRRKPSRGSSSAAAAAASAASEDVEQPEQQERRTRASSKKSSVSRKVDKKDKKRKGSSKNRVEYTDTERDELPAPATMREDRRQQQKAGNKETQPLANAKLRIPSIQVDTSPEDDDDVEEVEPKYYSSSKPRADSGAAGGRDDLRRGSKGSKARNKESRDQSPRLQRQQSVGAEDDPYEQEQGRREEDKKRAESSPRPGTRQREGSFNLDDEDGRPQNTASRTAGLQRQRSERDTQPSRSGKQADTSKSTSATYPTALRSSKSDTTERAKPTSSSSRRRNESKKRRSNEPPPDTTTTTTADELPDTLFNRGRAQSIKHPPAADQQSRGISPSAKFPTGQQQQRRYEDKGQNYDDNRSALQQQPQQQRMKRRPMADNLIDFDEQQQQQQRRVSSSVVTQTSNTLLYDRASGGETAPLPSQQQQQLSSHSRQLSKKGSAPMAKTSYDSVMSGYTTTGTQPPQVFDTNDMTTAEDDDRAYSIVDPTPVPAARKKSSVASAQLFRQQQQQQQRAADKPSSSSSRRLTAPDPTTPNSSQVTMHSVRSSLSGPVYAQTAAATVDDALERASMAAATSERPQESPANSKRKSGAAAPAPSAASRKQSIIQQQQQQQRSPPPLPQDNELSHVQQLADGGWRGATGGRAFTPNAQATNSTHPPRGGDKQTSSLLQLVASQPHLHPGQQQQQQFTVIQISEIIRPRVRQIIARRLALPTVDPSSDSNMTKVVDWIANRAAHRTLLSLAELQQEQQQAGGKSGSSPPFVQDVYRAVEQQIELAVRDMRQLLVQYRHDAAEILDDNNEPQNEARPRLTASQLKKQQKEEHRSSSRNEKRSRSRANSRQRVSNEEQYNNGRRSANNNPSPQHHQRNSRSTMPPQQQHHQQRDTSEYYNMAPIQTTDNQSAADMEPLQKSMTSWRRQR